MASVATNRIKNTGNGHSNGNGSNGNGHTNGKNRLPPEQPRKPVKNSVKSFTELEMANRFLRVDSLRAQAKALYAEIDRIEAEVLAAMVPGEAILLHDGRTAQVVDNFLDKFGQPKNVSYKPCGVRRFELLVK